jgi:hypothetical protein
VFDSHRRIKELGMAKSEPPLRPNLSAEARDILNHAQDPVVANQWDPIKGRHRALRSHRTDLRPIGRPSGDSKHASGPLAHPKQTGLGPSPELTH